MRYSVNFNMEIVDKVYDIDGELGPFSNAVLDKCQEGEYKEDAPNKNYPAVSGEDSKPRTYDHIFVIIDHNMILELHVSVLK